MYALFLTNDFQRRHIFNRVFLCTNASDAQNVIKLYCGHSRTLCIVQLTKVTNCLIDCSG